MSIFTPQQVGNIADNTNGKKVLKASKPKLELGFLSHKLAVRVGSRGGKKGRTVHTQVLNHCFFGNLKFCQVFLNQYKWDILGLQI